MRTTLAALLLSLSLTTTAYAAPSTPPGCLVVGIKDTEQFLRTADRKCFRNVTRAEAAGYEEFVPATSPALTGYRATLLGTNEVPPNNSTATGNCIAVNIVATSTLHLICTHNANSATAAHIHSGAAGVSGSVECDLESGLSPISASCTLTPTLLTSLEAGNLYVNVHTTGFAAGEIRGQLLAE